jgi:hypothetical protein
MSTVKVLRALTAQIQAGSTYETDNMFLLPVTSDAVTQMYDPVFSEAALGTGFTDSPSQASRKTGGQISLDVEALGIVPILEAAFGSNVAKVFTLGANSKKLSLCQKTSQHAIRYANVYVKSLMFNSAAAGFLSATADLIGVTAQDRSAVGNFPASPTAPARPFLHHELRGTGFFRVGDHTDALAAGDAVEITDFSFGLSSTGFDEQFVNASLGTATPAFGMVPPKCEASFTVSRFSADTFLAWADADTPLQLDAYFYKSATRVFRVEIPNFKALVDVSDDDLTTLKVTAQIGRNGLGASYTNGNMLFNSPIRITVINS